MAEPKEDPQMEFGEIRIEHPDLEGHLTQWSELGSQVSDLTGKRRTLRGYVQEYVLAALKEREREEGVVRIGRFKMHVKKEGAKDVSFTTKGGTTMLITEEGQRRRVASPAPTQTVQEQPRQPRQRAPRAEFPEDDVTRARRAAVEALGNPQRPEGTDAA